MSEKPEDKFLEFNKDNIFENLLQAEDHLKRMDEKTKNNSQDMIEALDHIQCVVKHIAMAKGESNEAKAHTLKTEPEKYEKYLELENILLRVREDISTKKATIPDLIKEVREARAYFEKFNPDYDVSKCQACGIGEKIVAMKPGEKKMDMTPEQFCNMTKDPGRCMDLMKALEHGPVKKEEFDVGKAMKNVQITASLLDNIARLSNRLGA